MTNEISSFFMRYSNLTILKSTNGSFASEVQDVDRLIKTFQLKCFDMFIKLFAMYQD